MDRYRLYNEVSEILRKYKITDETKKIILLLIKEGKGASNFILDFSVEGSDLTGLSMIKNFRDDLNVNLKKMNGELSNFGIDINLEEVVDEKRSLVLSIVPKEIPSTGYLGSDIFKRALMDIEL